MSEKTTAYLSEAETALLLRIARDSLERYVRDGERVDVEDYPLTDTLREPHGAFVTLRRQGELRGCIGYTKSLEPLALAVRDNAINAATRDPRFAPLSPEELPEINIEVSALCPGAEPGTPFIPVRDAAEIAIGRDGLYLECDSARGGLLLPQVPVEHHWSLDQFLQGICQKARVEEDAWKDPENTLYRFSAQVFAEPGKGGA